jgi:hypothetical protein
MMHLISLALSFFLLHTGLWANGIGNVDPQLNSDSEFGLRYYSSWKGLFKAVLCENLMALRVVTCAFDHIPLTVNDL